MLTFLRMLMSKAGWFVLSFVLIVAALAVINELPVKLRAWRAQAVNTEETLTKLTGDVPLFEQAGKSALQNASAEIADLKQANDAGLRSADEKIAMRRQEALERVLDGPNIALAAARGEPQRISASYRAEYIELPLLDRAASLISLRQENLRAVTNHRFSLSSLEQDRAKYLANLAAFNARVADRNAMQKKAAAQMRYPVCKRVSQLPGCDLVREIGNRDLQLKQSRKALQREAVVLNSKRAAMRELTLRREQVAEGSEIVTRATEAYLSNVQHLSTISGGYALNQARSTCCATGCRPWEYCWAQYFCQSRTNSLPFLSLRHSLRGQSQFPSGYRGRR